MPRNPALGKGWARQKRRPASLESYAALWSPLSLLGSAGKRIGESGERCRSDQHHRELPGGLLRLGLGDGQPIRADDSIGRGRSLRHIFAPQTRISIITITPTTQTLVRVELPCALPCACSSRNQNNAAGITSMFGATWRYFLSLASRNMHTVAVTQYPHHSSAPVERRAPKASQDCGRRSELVPVIDVTRWRVKTNTA